MSEVTPTTAAPATTESTETTQTTETQAQPTQAEVKAMKEKFKYTIDGEDVEEEVDLSNKEELRKRMQLAHAAKKRMAEAVAEKRKALEIVKSFENDDSFAELIRKHPKGREIAEKILLAKIQDEMQSPEEKAARAEKAELEQLRRERKEREDKDKKSAQEKLEAKYAESYQKTIIDALNKTSLPKTPEMVKRMASIMNKNLQLGLDLTAEELAQELKTEVNAIMKSIVGDADGDHLISLFGDDVAKKIRMSDIKKLQEKQNQVFQGGQKSQAQPSQSKDDSRAMSMEEWKESVNKRLAQK